MAAAAAQYWLAAAVAAAACMHAGAAPMPHIVVLLVDDLGHYDVGFTGNREVTSPTIDGLAAQVCV